MYRCHYHWSNRCCRRPCCVWILVLPNLASVASVDVVSVVGSIDVFAGIDIVAFENLPNTWSFCFHQYDPLSIKFCTNMCDFVYILSKIILSWLMYFHALLMSFYRFCIFILINVGNFVRVCLTPFVDIAQAWLNQAISVSVFAFLPFSLNLYQATPNVTISTEWFSLIPYLRSVSYHYFRHIGMTYHFRFDFILDNIRRTIRLLVSITWTI